MSFLSFWKTYSLVLAHVLIFVLTVVAKNGTKLILLFFTFLFPCSKRGFDVRSFGTGSHVKLPGPAPDKPNVYDFKTTYVQMYNDLVRKDKELYPLLTHFSTHTFTYCIPEVRWANMVHVCASCLDTQFCWSSWGLDGIWIQHRRLSTVELHSGFKRIHMLYQTHGVESTLQYNSCKVVSTIWWRYNQILCL